MESVGRILNALGRGPDLYRERRLPTLREVGELVGGKRQGEGRNVLGVDFGDLGIESRRRFSSSCSRTKKKKS